MRGHPYCKFAFRALAEAYLLPTVPSPEFAAHRLGALADRDKSSWARTHIDQTIVEGPGRWSFTTIPFAATNAWDMPRLRLGVCARAARLLHGRQLTEFEEAKLDSHDHR